jgi:tetratricopeptide (TPR) repeat protein
VQLILGWTVSLLSSGGDTVPQDLPSSQVEKIAKAVQSKDYARAERLSSEFVSDHPQQAMGWFYLGYARAAQQNFASAVEPYQKAVDLGLKEYKSYYQLGYCAHRAGSHASAAPALREALRLQPDSPDALYYLGVTESELREFALAEGTLSRLIALDSRWTELARFHRGIVRLGLGRQLDAEQDLRWVIQEGRSEELKPRAQDLLERRDEPFRPEAPRKPVEKTWRVALLEKAGYDSNVLRLPETSVARSTKDGDAFLMTFLMGSVELAEERLLTARLSLLDVSYADLSEFALDAVLAALESEAPLAGDLSAFASGHGEVFYLDRESFFRRAGVKGGLRYSPSQWVKVSVGGSYLAKDFRQEALQDLDASEEAGFLELELKRINPWLQALLRYELHYEHADAPDRAHLEHRVWARLEFTPGAALKGRLEGGGRVRAHDDVDRLYLKTREDERLGMRATVYYTIADRVQLFVEAEAERNRSNISDFDYGREVISVGLLVVF